MRPATTQQHNTTTNTNMNVNYIWQFCSTLASLHCMQPSYFLDESNRQTHTHIHTHTQHTHIHTYTHTNRQYHSYRRNLTDLPNKMLSILQFVSSLTSGQSEQPSHLQDNGMQQPSAHVKSELRHAAIEINIIL